jgi:hypothetical protein
VPVQVCAARLERGRVEGADEKTPDGSFGHISTRGESLSKPLHFHSPSHIEASKSSELLSTTCTRPAYKALFSCLLAVVFRATNVQIVIANIWPLLAISRAFSRYASVVLLISSVSTPLRVIILSRIIGTVSECHVARTPLISGLWYGASEKSVTLLTSIGKLCRAFSMSPIMCSAQPCAIWNANISFPSAKQDKPSGPSG